MLMSAIQSFRIVERSKSSRTFVSVLVLVLLVQPLFVVSNAASVQRNKKPAQLTGDQRIAHVLSRLTYGARPGDFERVKQMGVDAFIAQQLDPDAIGNDPMMAKLRRLPTLNL